MIKKHYASKTTDAACSMAYCNDCILNYLIEICPYQDGAPARITLDMNLKEEEANA